MKKKLVVLLAGVMLVSSITACGKDKGNTEALAVEGEGKVELCDYSNLKAEKNIYQVTQDEIDSYIDDLVYEYVDYKKVDRSAAENDYVDMELVGTSDGETVYDFQGDDAYQNYMVGGEDLGADFDKALKGKFAGDEFDVSVQYDGEFWDGKVAGKKVDYKVKVVAVNEEILPEVTDEFVKKELGYDSVDDMNKKVEEQIKADNEANSEDELRTNLLQMVVDGSTFESYSQSDYEDSIVEMEAYYEEMAEMYGADSLEGFLEMTGMTKKDIEKDALNQVYTMMVVEAIIQEQGLEVSEDEYQQALEQLAEYYEVESTDELIEQYGEAALRFEILRSKVCDYLQEHATIKEVEAQMDEEAEEE